MKKFISLLFISILLVGGFILINKHQSPTSSQSAVSPSSPPVISEVSKTEIFGTPVRFQIPKLGVDTAIESVGMDTKGNMDVPQNADNVAWYKLGYKIDSNGSAVIAAHFDKPDGSPAVFYSLSTLKTGDTVKVTDNHGTTVTYSISDSNAYPYDSFPLQQVFNSKGKSTLNLITCDGTWDKNKKTYNKRLVVSSSLITGN